MLFKNRVFVSTVLLVLFFTTVYAQEMNPEAGINSQLERPAIDHNKLVQNGIMTQLQVMTLLYQLPFKIILQTYHST